MDSSLICTTIAIIAYLIVIIDIGIIYSKKSSGNINDFYLGGRKLHPLVAAMSAEASDMSGWLLMGLPGLAYACGIAEAGWTAIGLAVGTYLNWLFVAKRLRCYTQVAGNSITLPDYFSRRYHDQKNILMFIAALVIIIFFVPYVASGFSTCGKLFNAFVGLDYFTGVVIGAFIIILYTVLGGFLAVCTTDLVQSIVMTIAILVVLFFGLSMVGGLGQTIDYANELPGYLNLFQGYDSANNSAGTYGWLAIVSTMAWGLGYFGMPQILLRFMGINSPSQVKISRRVASIWVIIALAVATFIGVIGYGMVQNGVIEALQDPEQIIVVIANLIGSYGVFPALIAGVILAGIMAASMSTADSQLLAASSSVSENIFRGTFKINLSERGTILTARFVVIVIALIAMFIARDPSSSIFEIVSFAWAGFGAAFGPVVLFSLFWKRSNAWGALAGMVSGGAMVFIWKFAISSLGGAWGIYELLPSFIISAILIVVVSLLTSPPSKEIEKEFDQVLTMVNNSR